MKVKLVVVQGKPEGKEIPLRTPKFLIGRGTECHLRPNSELISRNHCVFSLGETELRLRDLGSTNGTVVNGQRIAGEVLINPGDIVQVGSLGFRIVVDDPAAVPAGTPAVAAPAVASLPKPVAPVPAVVGKLGSKDAKDDDIHQWLLSDSKHDVPDSGSGVYTGDTQMLNLKNTTVERPTDQDTKTDVPIPTETPAETPKPEEEPEELIVEAEGGAKIKISAAKQKIEKTREDTSRAAADILRRMMERRPGPGPGN